MNLNTIQECEPNLTVHIAEARFREWIAKGVFTLKGANERLTAQFELIHLPFAVIDLSITTKWSASVASFRAWEWQRDEELFLRERDRYDQLQRNGGYRGRMPRSPDKNSYYDWAIVSDEWTGQDQLLTYAFDLQKTALSFAELEEACKFFGRTHISLKKRNQTGRSDPRGLVDPQVIDSLAAKQSLAVAKDAVKDIVSQYDKYREVNCNVPSFKEETDVFYIPFYKIIYEIDGKNYSGIIDAISGSSISGTRPKDKKKIITSAAFGVALALAVGIFANYSGNFFEPPVQPTLREQLAEYPIYSEPSTDSSSAPTSTTDYVDTNDSKIAGVEVDGKSETELQLEKKTETESPPQQDDKQRMLSEKDNTDVEVAAEPRGTRNQFSDDDFPDASRRDGEYGVVRATYIVDVDGKVRDCKVSQSSGFKRLDDETCKIILRRFRFVPATSNGRPVEEEKTQAVRWQLRE